MDDLDLIKQKINLVDLVSEYLPLKKAGVNFKAPCPFHQEKTPSFVVSPERQIWHCFGCGKGGDMFKFLMEKEGLDFVEALEILANKAGVVLKRKKTEGVNRKTRLFEINQKAAQFFHHLLINHKLGKKALDYLHTRGLTDETINQFNLGYAPNSWDSLLKFLLKRNFALTELTEVGLIVPSERGGYDRFRGRIIFPLIDVQNQIRGFSGRILGFGEPKYINSPQTLIFDKSQFLFGLNLSRSEIKQQNAVILTEGEMDMLMSYQAGVKHVVATKGTALTSGQIELIKRYTDNLILCFDKDLAGDSASRRGIELAERAGLSIKVIKIAGGKDPADLVLYDTKTWVKAVELAEPIYDYYLRSIEERFNLKSADGKKEAARELLPIWSSIADPLVKEHYIQKLAAHLEVPEEFLRGELAKVKDRALFSETGNYQNIATVFLPKTNLRSRREILEEYLMILLLKIPKTINFVPNFPETIFSGEDLRSVYVMLVLYLDTISFKTEEFSMTGFCQSLPEALVPIVDRLYLSEIDDKLIEPKNWEVEVKKIVLEVKKSLVKASLEKLSLQIKSAESFGKLPELELLNRRFRDLSLKLKSL